MENKSSIVTYNRHELQRTMDLGSNMVRKRIKQIFAFADSNNKGELTRQDYKVAIYAFTGQKPFLTETKDVFHYSNTMNLDEFTHQAVAKLKYRSYNSYLKDMYYALGAADKGFLIMDDLEKVRKEVLPGLPSALIQDVFRQVDTDMDGRVNYLDFITFLGPNCNNTLLYSNQIGGREVLQNHLKIHAQ